MPQVQIERLGGQAAVNETGFDNRVASPNASGSAEFSAALNRHREEIRASNAHAAQQNPAVSLNRTGQENFGDSLVDGIKHIDADYKSHRERLLKDLARAGEEGNAMDVMKYTFELNQLENQAQMCIKVAKGTASAVDQLVKIQ